MPSARVDLPAWAAQLKTGLESLALVLDDETQQRLLDFLVLLHKWNQAYNLTAVRDVRLMVPRQLLDSLAIAPWVTAQRFLDVGAGGGLPGLPLAILWPQRQVTLLDSNVKKTRFLTQVVIELGLKNVEVVHARAEDFHPATGYDQITSRAFTALPNLLHWCAHLLSSEGAFLAMKGQYPTDEVAQMPAGWQVTAAIPLQVPEETAQRHLLEIRRVNNASNANNRQL